MNKKFLKDILIWYVSLSSIIFICLYIISHFTTLTPTAYFDLFRSFTIIYILIVLYDVFQNRKNTQATKEKNKDVEITPNVIKNKSGKIVTDKQVSKMQRLYRWLLCGKYTITEICEIFTFVTVISSLMMVFYIDTPKIGEFAYKHLLMRLSIITGIMTIIEYKNIVAETKEIFSKIRTLSNMSKLDFICYLKSKFISNKSEFVSVIFTVSTVIYCLIFIFLVENPVGGVSLYFSLLVLFSVIIVIVLFAYLIIRNKKR